MYPLALFHRDSSGMGILTLAYTVCDCVVLCKHYSQECCWSTIYSHVAPRQAHKVFAYVTAWWILKYSTSNCETWAGSGICTCGCNVLRFQECFNTMTHLDKHRYYEIMFVCLFVCLCFSFYTVMLEHDRVSLEHVVELTNKGMNLVDGSRV